MSPDLIQISRWYKLFLVIDKQGNEVHNILEFCQYIWQWNMCTASKYEMIFSHRHMRKTNADKVSTNLM